MWTVTILLTLLFFLICLGFGLFVLVLASTAALRLMGTTRLQFIALAFTIGAPGSSVFLQLLPIFSKNISVQLGIVLLMSLVGFVATTSIWRPRMEDLTPLLRWGALSVPLALVTWWCSFGAFSSFPFADIGADVHWMKTALEYGNTGILNPYASQSYADIRGAVAGALSGTLGLDLLQFDWTYRYFSILTLMAFFYAFAVGIFTEDKRKWLAYLLAAAGNTPGLLTNGSLAVASSAVLLSALLKKGADEPVQPKVLSAPTLIALGGALLSAIVAFRINNNALMLTLIMGTSLTFNLLNRGGTKLRNLASYGFAPTIWAMALILSHRGAYLFVPTVIVAWLLYLALSRFVSLASTRSIKTLVLVSLAPTLACIAILASVAASQLGYLRSIQMDHLFSRITLLVAGKPIQPGDDISLGIGPTVAAIEIGRAIGPFLIVGCGMLFLWWCIECLRSNLSRSTDSPTQNRNVTLLLWSWIGATGLCMVVLSGFPFLYRTGLIITCLFAVAAAELFFQLLDDPAVANPEQRRIVAVIATLTIAAIVVFVSQQSYSDYPARLLPTAMAGVALALLFAALTFASASRLQIVALAALLGLGTLIDRSEIFALLDVYSYGQLPAHAVVSHYDSSDLKAARWLRANMRDYVIVSDPYTMGLTEAMTAAPGLYGFSNLDTVSPATAMRVKKAIAAATTTASDPRDKIIQACSSLGPLVAELDSEAFAQVAGVDLAGIIFRPVIEPKMPAQLPPPVEQPKVSQPPKIDIAGQFTVLNGGPTKWSIVVIVNPRTIRWLDLASDQRLPYFPIIEPLPQEMLKALDNGPFRKLFYDGENAIFAIECTKDTIDSSRRPR